VGTAQKQHQCQGDGCAKVIAPGERSGSDDHVMAPQYNQEFTDLFRGIRDLEINWTAIAASGSRVSQINLSRNEPSTLGSAFVAWYTRDGAQVRWPERGASAVTLNQAAVDGFSHPRMSEKKIADYIKQARSDWTLPAYDVERGYGAHRSVAALRANVEYNIRLAVIHGPIDHRVLRDLIVFERPL
jgi:hypothetical protein